MTVTGKTDTASSPNPGTRRRAFRAWCRSRPFWGGLLMLLAGLELLAIPLSGVLIQGQVKLVIYIGIGGVSGVLIGVLLIAAGITAWASPARQMFYGIAGLILGIVSFPASNLGGFVLGMLLAIIGGALAIAWTPARPVGRHRMPPAGKTARPDLPALLRNELPRTNTRPAGPGYRMIAMPAAALISLAGASGAAAAPGPCIAGLLCTAPATSPATPGSVSSSPPAQPGLLPPPAGSKPLGSRARPPGTKPAGAKNGLVKQASTPAGLLAPTAASVLTSKASAMTKFNFAGIAALPKAGGGSEQVLKFTAASASLTGVSITVTQDGKTVTTTTASVGFPAGLTMYTTRLCGQVEGIAPSICFTPSTASEVPLKLATILGKITPVTMTNVTASQFVNVAPATEWNAVDMATRT